MPFILRHMMCVSGLMLCTHMSFSLSPRVEEIAFSSTPFDTRSSTASIALAVSEASIDSVEFVYTTDNWAHQQSITASRCSEHVYTVPLPTYPAETFVAYSIAIEDAEAVRWMSVTNTYRVHAYKGDSNLVCRIMSANLTSGNFQSYEEYGIRLFQGLKPDIVGIQEFNYRDGTLRAFVNEAFGTEFHYYIEPGDEQLPTGIISRWPIIAAGEWEDHHVNNRDFSWAQIRLPSGDDVYVVSVHLWGNGGPSGRNSQAQLLTNMIQRHFPLDAYRVLCGDLNTQSRGETALQTFKTLLRDDPIPADQAGNENTNQPRNRPYDYVLPSPELAALQVPSVVSGRSFSKGLVYDSRVTSPYALLPSPIKFDDSDADGMQHMAVMKDFSFSMPGMRLPSLEPIDDVIALPDEIVQFDVRAYRANGLTLTATCSRASLFSPVSGQGMIEDTFSWRVTEDDIGLHVLVFTAEAGALYTTRMMTISVVPEPLHTGIIVGIILVALRQRGESVSIR